MIATIAGGLQTGMQVIGQLTQGEANKGAAEYNASVAAANAQIAKNKAAMAGAAGTAQVEQAQLQSRAKIGGLIASQAASGLNVNSGSALDVRSSAEQLGQLNAITVRSNAARQAYGYQTEAASDTGQQGLYQSEAKNAMPAAEIGAAGTVLGGVGSAASRYGEFQLQAGRNSLNSGSDYYGTGSGTGGLY